MGRGVDVVFEIGEINFKLPVEYGVLFSQFARGLTQVMEEAKTKRSDWELELE